MARRCDRVTRLRIVLFAEGLAMRRRDWQRGLSQGDFKPFMRIIRYADRAEQLHYAVEQSDGSCLRAGGDPSSSIHVSSERADIHGLLAAMGPTMIWRIISIVVEKIGTLTKPVRNEPI